MLSVCSTLGAVLFRLLQIDKPTLRWIDWTGEEGPACISTLKTAHRMVPQHEASNWWRFRP